MALAATFPGQGSQQVGMGKALADAFPQARAVFDEVDEALGEKLSAHHLGRARGQPDADGQCPAGADGRFDGGACARWRARGFSLASTGQIRRRPFAWRIFGAVRRRYDFAGRHGPAAAHSRQCHAGCRCRSARARWRPSSALSMATWKPHAARPPAGGVCQIANDNGGGQLVISGSKAVGRPRLRTRSRSAAPSARSCCRYPPRSIPR